MEQHLYRWVKASDVGLPPIEIVTFEKLVEYGKNNGANIVNNMPWSFEYKGRPVTHENDEKYLVGVMSATCTKDNPVVLFNNETFNYWENVGRLNVLHKGRPDVLICCEGSWSFWSGKNRGSHIRVVREDLKYIEWLEPVEEHNQEEQAQMWNDIAARTNGVDGISFHIHSWLLEELSSKYHLIKIRQ